MRHKRGSGLIAKIYIEHLSNGFSEIAETIDPITKGKKISVPNITSILICNLLFKIM